MFWMDSTEFYPTVYAFSSAYPSNTRVRFPTQPAWFDERKCGALLPVGLGGGVNVEAASPGMPLLDMMDDFLVGVSEVIDAAHLD